MRKRSPRMGAACPARASANRPVALDPSRQEKPVPRPLSEQVVVVTGASSGIGLCTARAFAAAGAAVVATARSRERLDALVEEIVATGGRAHAAPADVR